MKDLVALLFGAAIVVFFSYDRFNRTTDEAGQQLQGLVNLLSPDKLRSGRVVFNAYIFYALTFLVIYLFLCAYAELIPALGGPDLTVGATKLPTLASEGGTPGFVESMPVALAPVESAGSVIDSVLHPPLPAPATSAGRRPSFDIGIDSSTSLAVALMIVGLAPAFPILQRFEAWMRGAAHRLAGIPTRVLSARDELRTETMALKLDPDGKIPADTLLIPRSDWERMAYYRAKAKDQREVTEDFHNDLGLIFAVSAWILDRRLKLANSHVRERFVQFEQELRNRKSLLVNALDEKTEFQLGTDASGSSEGDAATAVNSGAELGVRKPASWDRLASDADKLADDICILLAIYTEHDIIVSEPSSVHPDGTQSGISLQKRLAREKLELFLKEHLSDQGGNTRFRSNTLITGLWAFFVVVVVTVPWSLFVGAFELRLQLGASSDPYWRIMVYLSTALSAYGIPMLTALALRDGSMQLRRWHNLLSVDWTIAVPQAAFVLFVSWGLATVLIVGVALWQAGVAFGWETSAERFWSTLRFSFAYNAPTAFRGACLALIVILMLDARRAPKWQARLRSSARASLVKATIAALVMAVVGATTRSASSWAGALQASVPRQGLDDIDWGLIVYAAIYTALLAFCIVFAVSEVLRTQRLRPAAAGSKARVG